MARPLRIEYPGGRYHVTVRGNERRAIYRDETDRFRFLELLGEMSERFGVRVHAYVLMDNHFHLLVETPEANLSRAMQWLGVSYSVGFNRPKHPRMNCFSRGTAALRFWRAFMPIKPGEVYRADLGMAAKVRPVLIVSREDDNRPRDLVLAVPLTTENRGSQYEVTMPRVRFLHEISTANVQGLQPFRPADLQGLIGRFETSAMEPVKAALGWAMDFKPKPQ